MTDDDTTDADDRRDTPTSDARTRSTDRTQHADESVHTTTSADTTPVDSAAAFAERMVPFEPYTAAELAADLELQIEEAETYLKTLEAEEIVRSKKPPNTKRLWLREPKPQACSNCGRDFEIKYLHAIFGSAQFCPRCGTRL